MSNTLHMDTVIQVRGTGRKTSKRFLNGLLLVSAAALAQSATNQASAAEASYGYNDAQAVAPPSNINQTSHIQGIVMRVMPANKPQPVKKNTFFKSIAPTIAASLLREQPSYVRTIGNRAARSLASDMTDVDPSAEYLVDVRVGDRFVRTKTQGELLHRGDVVLVSVDPDGSFRSSPLPAGYELAEQSIAAARYNKP